MSENINKNPVVGEQGFNQKTTFGMDEILQQIQSNEAASEADSKDDVQNKKSRRKKADAPTEKLVSVQLKITPELHSKIVMAKGLFSCNGKSVSISNFIVNLIEKEINKMSEDLEKVAKKYR